MRGVFHLSRPLAESVDDVSFFSASEASWLDMLDMSLCSFLEISLCEVCWLNSCVFTLTVGVVSGPGDSAILNM